MRKKYLSALLFGALLFASAGTFTSCKDYDDDINNLQEQINTINTTLTELKNQIGSTGVSSVTFDEASGVLTVVDGTGTKNYNISTSATAMVEAEIKDGKLYINDEEIGAVVGEVTVADGKLMVDGKEVASLGGESNVVLVKNEDAQTCTLTVGDQTVTLPLAATSLDVTTYETVFSAYGVTDESDGIRWGVSTVDIADWEGPKGAIAKGDFLIGIQNEVNIKVMPTSYDLSTAKLELVDVNGNIAPVNVIAKGATYGSITSGSRTADPKGEWNLSIEFTDEVTKDNISTIFTAEENGKVSNKLYALAVDGVNVTGYEYVIDTNIKETSNCSDDVNSNYIKALYNGKSSSYDLETDKSYTLVYNDPNVYDYHFYFSDEDVNDAEAAGVTLKDNVLTTDKIGGNTYAIKVDVVYVDGTKKTLEDVKYFSIGQNVVEEAAAGGEYTLTANLNNSSFVVDLGSAFTGLTAAEAISSYVSWSIEQYNDKGDVCPIESVSTVKYYADEACTQEVSANDWANNIRTIKYAKIFVSESQLSTNYEDAAPGTYNFKLRIYNSNGTKEVSVPVTISAPKFTDLFATNANWTDNVLTLPISSTGNVDMALAYNPTTGVAFDSNLSVTFSKINNSTPINESTVSENTATVSDNVLTFVSEQQGQFQIATNVIENNALKTLTAETAYKVHGFKNFTVKSGKFTVKLANPWEGAKLVYYKDSKEVTPLEITGTTTEFAAFETVNNKKQGIALVLNGDKVLTGTIMGVELGNTWKSSFGSAVPTTANANATVDANGNVTVTMSSGASTSAGYTSTMTLKYPVVTVDGSVVYATMTVDIKVNQF